MRCTFTLLGGRIRATALPKKAVRIKPVPSSIARRVESSNMKEFERLIKVAKRQQERRITLAVAEALKRGSTTTDMSAREKRYESNKVKAQKELQRLSLLAMKQRQIKQKEVHLVETPQPLQRRAKREQLAKERQQLEGEAEDVFINYLSKVKADRDANIRQLALDAIKRAADKVDEKVKAPTADDDENKEPPSDEHRPKKQSPRKEQANAQQGHKQQVAEDRFLANIERLKVKREERLRQALEKKLKGKAAEVAATPSASSTTPEAEKVTRTTKKEEKEPTADDVVPVKEKKKSERAKTPKARKSSPSPPPPAAATVDVVDDDTVQILDEETLHETVEVETLAEPAELAPEVPIELEKVKRSPPRVHAPPKKVTLPVSPAVSSTAASAVKDSFDAEKEKAGYFELLRKRVDTKLSSSNKQAEQPATPWPSSDNTTGLFRL